MSAYDSPARLLPERSTISRAFCSWRTVGSRSTFGEEARAELPEDPTDEQLLAAWRPFFARAGTYEVKGHEIHTKVIVGKNPNATAEQEENSASFEVDGDTMFQTFTNDAGTVTFKVKYTRVE